ncbi:MAG: PAS domain-containing protein [Verrucomicrobia bacterium]|nr:PAS domain-containing protein [Verrucomicrobiota bacterium]
MKKKSSPSRQRKPAKDARLRVAARPPRGVTPKTPASPREMLQRTDRSRNRGAISRDEPARVSFPIIGIGASAGGLEALERFLSHVPKKSGLAFVIVQHLDPTRKGIMPELLQRATAMRVIQVKDRTPVQTDQVYVIPPNKDMSILHGVLHLLEPASPRGLRLPIDFFLRSLAQDQQEHSIAVILSGMGSDGTLGLRDVKEKGGLVLVQDLATAKFDGMPRSAIDSGLADIVAPVDELPGRILAFLQRTPLVQTSERALEDKTRSALDKAIILLRTHTGHDFSLYKKNTFYRRIERRMGIHQIDKIAAYIRYLQENSQELDLLFKELLIGVTSFFRDPAVWEELRSSVLPALLAKRPSGHAVRAWVPGCSTGEEAYSLAMVFKEAVGKLKPAKNFTLNVFATDLDKDAIDKARHGVYPANVAADVSPARLARFFTKFEGGYRVASEIREMVVFAPQSLIQDPPFTKLDILSCRNLLIYLAPEMQKKLIPLFHYSLAPAGILLLGSAETIGGFTDLFASLGGKTRLYRRTESALREGPIEFPSSFAPRLPAGAEERPETKTPLSLQTLADQLVLEHYAAPTVLANDKGNILYVSGRTGKYLEPAAGKANWNIFAMAREGLRYELTSAFQKALGRKGPVEFKGLRVRSNGGEHYVDITVQQLAEPEPLRGLVIIVFADVNAPLETKPAGPLGKHGQATVHKVRLTELERKHQQVCMELQTTREEMQSSQEELRSTNEEMQSTNEELQSTNEELTTSKEEMQSLNEELQTVNTELQAKVDELSRSNNDMKNLLNSTDIATLFLDNELRVRRFTTQATKIIQLIPGDVGRPITDLASDLLYPELPTDAREVLQKLGFAERPVRARDGRWFTVRIMPYRTLDDRIDGVVITFTDITVAKRLEAQLREKHAVLERHVAEQSPEPARARGRGKPGTAERKAIQKSHGKPAGPGQT